MPNPYDSDENTTRDGAPASDSSTEESAQESETGSEAEENSFDTPEASETDEGQQEESEESVETPPAKAPFNEHPRFRELIEQNRELKAMIEAEKKAREEATRLANATPEERAAMELVSKYGLAPKKEVEELKRALAAVQDSAAFDKFIQKHPEAAKHAKALKALAYSNDYLSTPYEEIYKSVFGGADPERKVIARKIKTGIRPTGGGSKGTDNSGKHIYTREEIRSMMGTKEWEKHRAEIQKQMNAGLIK